MNPMTPRAAESQSESVSPVRDAPTEPATRNIAAIDVGTNSIRLIVAQAHPDGSYQVIDDEKKRTRLGEGADAADVLGDEPMRRSAAAIARLTKIADTYNVSALRVVATSAVREARNAPDFVRLVREQAGVDLDVISGDAEARLAYRSASHAFDLPSDTVAIIDVGGGSTEIILATAGAIERVWSLPLGAVRLSERFEPLNAHADPAVMLDALARHIDRALLDASVAPGALPTAMIGSGGTFTNLARISLRDALRDTDGAATQGHEMRHDEITSILARLASLTDAERATVPGLSPSRADIIVAGVAIAAHVMNRLDARTLRVNKGGVRDGLLLQIASELARDAHGPMITTA